MTSRVSKSPRSRYLHEPYSKLIRFGFGPKCTHLMQIVSKAAQRNTLCVTPIHVVMYQQQVVAASTVSERPRTTEAKARASKTTTATPWKSEPQSVLKEGTKRLEVRTEATIILYQNYHSTKQNELKSQVIVCTSLMLQNNPFNQDRQ